MRLELKPNASIETPEITPSFSSLWRERRRGGEGTDGRALNTSKTTLVVVTCIYLFSVLLKLFLAWSPKPARRSGVIFCKQPEYRFGSSLSGFFVAKLQLLIWVFETLKVDRISFEISLFTPLLTISGQTASYIQPFSTGGDRKRGGGGRWGEEEGLRLEQYLYCFDKNINLIEVLIPSLHLPPHPSS